jgi:hypothetical protein
MHNPIVNILPNDLYHTLLDLNLLNRKALRDIEIKHKYLELRKSGIPSADCIEIMLKDYPYLQFDTLRKIIYSVRLPEEGGMPLCI